MRCDACGRFFSAKSKGWTYRDIDGTKLIYCSCSCAMRDNDLTPVPICRECGEPVFDDCFVYDEISGDIYCSQKCAFCANGIKVENQ